MNSISSPIITNWQQISQTGIIPAGMSLLREDREFNIVQARTVNEEKTGIKKMRLTGIIQKADIFNENGRRYDSGILTEAVNAIQESISNRKVMGEFDHPADAKIHMDRVSHLMTKVWMENNNVLDELEEQLSQYSEALGEISGGKGMQGLVDHTIQISNKSKKKMFKMLLEDDELMDLMVELKSKYYKVLRTKFGEEAAIEIVANDFRYDSIFN